MTRGAKRKSNQDIPLPLGSSFAAKKEKKDPTVDDDIGFAGNPVPANEAREKSSLGSSFATKKKNKLPTADEDISLAGNPVPANEAREKSSLGSSFATKKIKKLPTVDDDTSLVGNPVPANEAREKWPERYQSKNKVKTVISPNGSEDCESTEKEVLQARRHYTQAIVDGCIFKLYDDAYVKAEKGEPDFIAKIVELFETIDGEPYFTAQWFYRTEDTIIKKQAHLVDQRRVFYSDIRDDNPLDSIVSKVKIARLLKNVDMAEKGKAISSSDLYYDMTYSLPYFTFTTISTDQLKVDSDASSVTSSEASSSNAPGDTIDYSKSSEACNLQVSEMTLLDLYSGCGAMSTGLCFGASISGLKLITRWAVDINSHACESLRINHPETEVRNEAAEDFLHLLKDWEKLCQEFPVDFKQDSLDSDEDDDAADALKVPHGEFEVRKLVAICYGDPNNVSKRGLYFKVRWMGYGPSEDTWEPSDGLSKCKERIKEFVTRGYKSKILPLPGDVDCICGGPPCQGISGFNRFRDQTDPLKDPKNHQVVVFMDIIEFLKPKYILMENVCDILKYAGGALVSYAIGRLVSMNYQARLGIMAAGSYGVAQCRMRVFLWGAHQLEKLPQYPLPTHAVIGRGIVINEFKEIIVGSDNGQSCMLERSTLLGDTISDLPPVTNYENREEMLYGGAPRNTFQKHIRFRNKVAGQKKQMLYDHLPLKLNEDDYERVCRIPKRKGANFRDLPGVMVGSVNKAQLDPSMERVLLPSGKPLVPDYAIKFVRGTSTKPFGRLGMDDIVTTVVTRAEPHNQVILHPDQDRVLTVRENARLQGFPDFYKLQGTVKQRYIQVGNAVAFPVSIALGYALGKASQGVHNSEPLMTLPMKFPDCLKDIPCLDESD
ncbi:putative DNA (cytosine-5)-methyltransferase CMT1 [Cornus florida]|uniref:putative DNA (cytosine-5)-methyltransferase CMT1 n=1 Tax=Cornus florida TaxID=4283 RepID=UPI00289E1AC6|nr:putative DNA (cytosine-5)-methyltransferase CMT1 [Cornus florida]